MGIKQKRYLGLVGAGHWGKNLARNFYSLGVLHSLCDANQALLEGYKNHYSEVRLTSDYSSLLQDAEVKCIAIAAPAILHYDLAKKALEAGKDVYVEKPLCLDVREGEALITLARQKGLILMVGHLLQYHPCVRKLQEMVGSGELGKLQYIASNRLNLGKIRKEENVLWSFAPHDISIILSLCGQRLPEQVRCMGSAYLSSEIADTSMTFMRFPDNITAHIYVNWLNPFKEQKLTVVGSGGMLVFDDTLPWEQKLLLYRNHVTWAEGHIPVPSKVAPEKIAIVENEPLLEECSHFLNCCEKRLKPRTDGEEGLRVLKVLQAAQESLMEDGEVKDPRHSTPALIKPEYFVHPTAIVDLGAEIGQGTKIWHFSHVMSDTKIGVNCNLGQNVLISPGCVLGRNVKIQNNVSLYTGVICEDDVFLGPSAVFTNVINPRSAVNRRGEYQKTLMRRGVTIGANATIVCGVELGEYAFVGAGAVVTKDIKPYALVVGNPARQIGWMSRHGEKLDLPLNAKADDELIAKCPATGEFYRLTGSSLTYLGLENEALTCAEMV